VSALLGAIPGATPARLDGCGRATVAVPPGRVRVQKCEFLAGVGAIRAFPIPVPQRDADLVVVAPVDSDGPGVCALVRPHTQRLFRPHTCPAAALCPGFLSSGPGRRELFWFSGLHDCPR